MAVTDSSLILTLMILHDYFDYSFGLAQVEIYQKNVTGHDSKRIAKKGKNRHK